MNSDIVRNSIQIYKIRNGFRLHHEEIIKKIKDENEHKYPITVQNDDSGEQKYARFDFLKRELDSSNKDVLYYDIFVKRDTLVKDEPNIINHSICFTDTKKGCLIVSGMQFRDTLLKYLTVLIHNQLDVFSPISLYRDAMEKFMDKLLRYAGNTVYRPRFHYANKYKNHQFEDYTVDELSCATKDPIFKDRLKRCHYFDPIFFIKNITKTIYENDPVKQSSDIRSRIKINHVGRIYSSKSLSIDQWVMFIKKLLTECA